MRTIKLGLVTNNNFSTFSVYTGTSNTGPWIMLPAPNNVITRENLATPGGYTLNNIPELASHIRLVANAGFCSNSEVVIEIDQVEVP